MENRNRNRNSNGDLRILAILALSLTLAVDAVPSPQIAGGVGVGVSTGGASASASATLDLVALLKPSLTAASKLLKLVSGRTTGALLDATRGLDAAVGDIINAGPGANLAALGDNLSKAAQNVLQLLSSPTSQLAGTIPAADVLVALYTIASSLGQLGTILGSGGTELGLLGLTQQLKYVTDVLNSIVKTLTNVTGVSEGGLLSLLLCPGGTGGSGIGGLFGSLGR